MYRRAVSLLLLPTVLLAQWVGAARCHGPCPAGGPDRLPHVHLPGLGVAGRCPCGARHDHHGDDHHHDGDPDGEEVACTQPAGGHDRGDVLYLPPAFAHGWLSEQPSVGGDGNGALPADPLPSAAVLGQSPADRPFHPPPDPPPSACPAYLRHSALLL